jgi:hypothetical protein
MRSLVQFLAWLSLLVVVTGGCLIGLELARFNSYIAGVHQGYLEGYAKGTAAPRPLPTPTPVPLGPPTIPVAAYAIPPPPILLWGLPSPKPKPHKSHDS